MWWGKSPNKIEKSILKIEFLYIFDWNMFENSIFKIEFSILLGLFPHHNLYRLNFQSFVLREYEHSAFQVCAYEFGGCVCGGWGGCWLCSECYLMWLQSVVRSKDVRCKVCVGVGVDVRGWRGEWWWVNLVYVWYMYEVYNV